ncbi:hypothetical protein [Candidatus Pantoea formicae]|uniref:hypothetical protein n=1 Tax=Candidatus Pantoea formicae TaxID=2608355 RepID=UPI003ED926AD
MNSNQKLAHEITYHLVDAGAADQEVMDDCEKWVLDRLNAQPVSQRYKLPDGWKLVPIEPTEDMIVDGFESEPDETFSEAKVWEEYEEMSGCQQAAHRAKLCWQAMLAAAPEVE